MADSIVRLRVDTKDYDANIKAARQGLLAMEEACRKVGGTFEVVEKADLEFVRALGRMETTTRSAKGSISELTKTFTDISAQYKRLTDEEKSSPFGKAMAESLNQLKGRIQEGNAELKNIQGEIAPTSDILETLAGKFGLNVAQMTKFWAIGATVATAMKVAKDAFFASEANLDEWGRTVESAQSVYQGFLTSLNTGDISGFLSRINEIIGAARSAYDELDRLGTQKAMDNRAVKTQQTENERMRAMLRTGRYLAPLDGRANEYGLNNGDKLSKANLDKIAKDLEEGLKNVNNIMASEIEQTAKSIDALYKQEAINLGMSAEAFRKGTANMQEFDKVLEGYNKYKQFEAAHTTNQTMQSSVGAINYAIRDSEKNPYEQYKAWATFLDDGAKFSKINELINQKSALETQQYNAQAQAFRAVNKAEKAGGVSSAKETTVQPFSMKDVEARDFGNMEYSLTELKNLLSYWQNVADTTRDTMERSKAQGEAQSIQKKIDVFDITPSEEAMSDFRDKVQQMMASFPPLEVEVSGNKTAKFAKETADAWSAASHAISNAGSAMAQLEDPATKVAGIIMQAVANVALGFAQALASPATGAAGIFGWIAAATAGIATMTATIASIKSATAYHAEGGVVGATSLSRGSDVVPAMLTPGEVVLNYSQQANLANSLQNRNEGVQYGGRSTISGEQIVTVVNAYGRRTGRGEILR